MGPSRHHQGLGVRENGVNLSAAANWLRGLGSVLALSGLSFLFCPRRQLAVMVSSFSFTADIPSLFLHIRLPWKSLLWELPHPTPARTPHLRQKGALG